MWSGSGVASGVGGFSVSFVPCYHIAARSLTLLPFTSLLLTRRGSPFRHGLYASKTLVFRKQYQNPSAILSASAVESFYYLNHSIDRSLSPNDIACHTTQINQNRAGGCTRKEGPH